MAQDSTDDFTSMFQDGKLIPGIYKIQNLGSGCYLDANLSSKQAHTRPTLPNGRGLWEIKPLGAGYTLRIVNPGEPEEFCTAIGPDGSTSLFVSPYLTAWRMQVINDGVHGGREYVRFFCGLAAMVWGPPTISRDDGVIVSFYAQADTNTYRIWKLIPVEVKSVPKHSQSSSGALGSGSPPVYDGDGTPQSSARAQHVAESQSDDFGTVVTEVTTVFTTTTTRKKYRVRDA